MDFRLLPPLSALKALAAVAETRSMTRAGAILNVSHAAISQQIRVLERHLGLKLILREGRGITFTPQGAQLAEAVGHGFAEIAECVRSLTGADAERPLQISTTPMFTASWLMPRIGDFRRRHPDIDIMLNPTPDIVDLSPGGIDIAIRFGDGNWHGVHAEKLFDSDFVIVAARELIGEKKISDPAELLAYPWLQELGTDEASEWLRSHGVTSGRVASMTHLPGNFLVDALRRGEGIAATTRAFIEDDIASGNVKVLFEEKTGETGYYVVTRPGVLRPSAQALLTWLRRQVRESSAPDSS